MIYLLLSPDPQSVRAYGSSGSALNALCHATGSLPHPEAARLLRAGVPVSIDGLSVLPLPVLRSFHGN